MKKFLISLIMLFSSAQAFPGPINYNLILHDVQGAGLFSMADRVLALARFYDENGCAGFEINFYDKGLYYNKWNGENWWNYYFEPIKYKNVKKNLRDRDEFGSSSFVQVERIYKEQNRKQAKYLIDKYLKIKPFILEQVDRYQKNNFNGFVLGVHYRGTDHKNDMPNISYSRMKDNIDIIMMNQKVANCKIFVATDEQPFLEYMLKTYGSNRVIYLNEQRSTDGKALHIGGHAYQNGMDAMCDMLLLSRCSYMVATVSNLNRWSTYYNVNLPFTIVLPN